MCARSVWIKIASPGSAALFGGGAAGVSPPRLVSEPRGQFGRLGDRALGIEFGGDVGAADHVHGSAEGDQLVRQGSIPFLARADDDVVHRERLRSAVDGDMQPGIIDPFVGDAAEHLDAFGLERRAMHPAGGLVEALAWPSGSPLQQPYLARRGFGSRAGQSTAPRETGVYAPFAAPARDVGGR